MIIESSTFKLRMTALSDENDNGMPAYARHITLGIALFVIAAIAVVIVGVIFGWFYHFWTDFVIK